ncbi:hypothetical protein ACT6NV_00925 [Robiginitalea sp. IMCC44478]|uniref:hypothetical protein n=1 Tax=Robiginitalea sp. IMCC44478 TaxID=3459122 RepID=UPI004043429E
MDKHSFDKKGFTRRKLLPVILGGFLLPYLGFGKEKQEADSNKYEDNETYDTFLKADGSIVRVKRKATRNARVVSKRVNNKTLLNWLGKSNS